MWHVLFVLSAHLAKTLSLFFVFGEACGCVWRSPRRAPQMIESTRSLFSQGSDRPVPTAMQEQLDRIEQQVVGNQQQLRDLALSLEKLHSSISKNTALGVSELSVNGPPN